MRYPGLPSRFFLVGLLLSAVVSLVAWGFRTAPDAARQQLMEQTRPRQEIRVEQRTTVRHHRHGGRRMQSPLFPACPNQPDYQKRKRCADRELLQYVQMHLKHPETLTGPATGSVVVRFRVEASGLTGQPEVVRSSHPAFGRAGREVVRRILHEHPVWEPALRGGRPVASEFILPIRFHLR
ncbi:energy transducer TonB [Neolewinella litorea]|uniref:Energy transducer TonB n=1 Tax=Neolewinella litorea TaxID=2562452 RepID=A0A4S4NKC8_9BACT|nr:energy transducer TonB [Neolewinella litorea]THH39247.1 energy transducer TonB [Neolewinella litorea]